MKRYNAHDSFPIDDDDEVELDTESPSNQDRPAYGAASRRPQPRRPGSGLSSPQRSRTSQSAGGSLMARFNQRAAANREAASIEPVRIEFGSRLIALGIDFFAGYLISFIIMPIPFVGRLFDYSLVIIVFLLVRDFLFEGRGIGKNLMGLRVVDMATGGAPSFRQALDRNLIYLGPLFALRLLALILQALPINQIINYNITNAIGQVINLIIGLYVLVILPIEIYRIYQREDSMRLGDEWAGTCLVKAGMDFSNPMSR